MTTSNPFQKCAIYRDEEDLAEMAKNVIQPTKATPQTLGTDQAKEQKKKKVRPDKKDVVAQDDNEGFEEVGKKKTAPQKRRHDNEDDQIVEKGQKKERPLKKEGAPKDSNRPHKREFDRKSGTGRGKEVAKGGAGGRGTWGDNPRQVERNYDDYYFQSALNPKEKTQSEPQTEEKKVEEQAPKEEVKQTEEKTEENYHDFKQKKGRPEAAVEVKKEDLLEIPTDAITAEEYLKNKPVSQVAQVVVAKPKDTEALEVREKVEENAFVLSTTAAKKKNKTKEKKVNKKEEELSKAVLENLKIGTESANAHGYTKKDYQKKQQFHFDPKDFPKI